MEFARSYRIPKLADIGRCDLCNDLSSFSKGVGQLEDLGFVGDSSEWTADHAHAAGYAFILVDGGASLFIALDGFYTAGTFAGAFFMGDGIVRTDSFASSAMDTFVLVDEGFSVYHGNGAFGAGE